MPANDTITEPDMSFIRLLFVDAVEEDVAYRWARRLARSLGPQATQLRPQTTLAELLRWALACGTDSIDFVVVFEPELRMELAGFLEQAGHTTFREMVEHYARRFQTDAH